MSNPDGTKRTCLGCREEKSKRDLIRLVAGPEGGVVIDYKGNLPGRGAYLCPKELCVRDAFSKKHISRVFEGAGVEGVEKFIIRLREKVLGRAMSLISLARKAGKVIDGKEAVEKGIEKGRIRLLLLAEDLSQESFKEMAERCLRKGIVYCTYLSKNKIGALLGKGERGAVGITDGAFSSLLGKEMSRLESLGNLA